MGLISALLFLLVSAIDAWIPFGATSEFVPGRSWVYLPAGVCLLCTLLFGGAGTIGLWLGSWIISAYYFYPEDMIRALSGSIASALGPYFVYKMAQQLYCLQASLTNLNAKKLFLLILACSIASPVLHHMLLALNGYPTGMELFVMSLGDFFGILVLIYLLKWALWLAPSKFKLFKVPNG